MGYVGKTKDIFADSRDAARKKVAYLGCPDSCPMCGKKRIGSRMVQEGNKWFTYVNHWVAVGGVFKTSSRTSKDSYSVGKGLLGAAVFGPVGAVAGIGGKTTYSGRDEYAINLLCPDCGFQMTYQLHTDSERNNLREACIF